VHAAASRGRHECGAARRRGDGRLTRPGGRLLHQVHTVLSIIVSVLGIRIRRIRMFLGLPDPNPIVRAPEVYVSGSGSFPFFIQVLSGLKIMLADKILTQNLSLKQ
jgi:hypothetical protein